MSGPPNPSRPFSRSRGFRGRQSENREEHRINEFIRVPQVRLIDEKGAQVGIIDTREALRMARERNLDLMEVAAKSRPPVCKIVDYGKFKYEKKKKEHVAKKKQTTIKVKEIQLRPNTDEHDLDYKFRNARRFLEGGDKVKASMRFRGREITNVDKGFELLERLIKVVEDVAAIEAEPNFEGRKLIMVLAPAKAGAQDKDKGPLKLKRPKKPVSRPPRPGGRRPVRRR